MKPLAPLGQLRQAEPNRAAHHAVMGNLLSLDVSIHERGADAEVGGGVPNGEGELFLTECSSRALIVARVCSELFSHAPLYGMR